MKYIKSASLFAAILSVLLLLVLLSGCEALEGLTDLGKAGNAQSPSASENAAVSVYVNGNLYQTIGKKGGTVSLPALTAPAGYEIDAWYSDAAYTLVYNGENTAYARYLPISYTITLEQVDDGDIQTSFFYTVENPDYTLPTPTRPGYVFLGWTVDGGTERYTTVTIPHGSSGDHTFTAVWELTVYQITYDTDGGLLLQSNPSTYTILTDSFVLNDPTRLGYFFLGWELDGTLYESPCTVEQGTTGDLSFRAVWSKTVYKLSVSSDLSDAAVTTTLGSDILDVSTPVRVTAPLLQGKNRFVGWERGGSIASTSPVYEFLMPAESVNLRAIYQEIVTVPYDPSSGSGLLLSLPDGSVPTRVSGEGLRLGVDTETRADGVLVSPAFLSGLEPGLHLFYLASATDDGYLYLEVTGSLPAVAPAAHPTDARSAPYFEKTLTYGGKTYFHAASTPEEFCALVEYFTLVDGVLQYRQTPTVKSYKFPFLIYGDLFKIMSDPSSRDLLLDAAIKRVSFPMSPSFSSSWNSYDATIEYTLTVVYGKGMNTEQSKQKKSAFADQQEYLSKTGRADDFESFPIDALTDTLEMRTLYELERLPYGYRPTFAATAADAEEVYLAARQILRRIIDDKMDDYAKVVAIYAWLGENVTYDSMTASGTSYDVSTRAFTVYGALIDRLAVCDGFSSAFRLLCQIEGIRAEEYTGVNEEGNASTGHAWNKVWVGGAVFGIDATWSRPNELAQFVTPQYLFLDEAGMLETDHYENAWEGIGYTQACAMPGFDFLTSVETAPGYDLVVESKAELNAVISYMKSTGKKFILFRLENGLTKNDLEKAIFQANVSCSYGLLGDSYGYIIR